MRVKTNTNAILTLVQFTKYINFSTLSHLTNFSPISVAFEISFVLHIGTDMLVDRS